MAILFLFALSCDSVENKVKIYLSADQIDFGMIFINTTDTRNITFTNNSKKDVTIANASITGTNAGDFTIISGWTGSPIVVSGEQTQLFGIEFHPTTTGAKAATLEVEHDDTSISSPLTAELEGNCVVDTTVSVTPDTHCFGLVFSGNSKIQLFDIKNEGTVTVDIIDIDKTGSNPGNFEILGWAGPVQLDGGNSIQIDIKFNQTGSTNKYMTLRIIHTGSNSPVYASLSGGDYIQENFPLGLTSIRSTGIDIVSPLSGHFDDQSFNVNIGFIFEYYGRNCTDVNVCDNGFVSFIPIPTTPLSLIYNSRSIPDTTEPNEALYVFWDDVEFTPSIYPEVRFVYQLVGSAPNRILTIEWFHFNFYYTVPPPAPEKVTYQIKLYETTNVIEFLYSSLSNDWSGTTWRATVGIENYNGTHAIQKTGSPNISSRPIFNFRFKP